MILSLINVACSTYIKVIHTVTLIPQTMYIAAASKLLHMHVHISIWFLVNIYSVHDIMQLL